MAKKARPETMKPEIWNALRSAALSLMLGEDHILRGCGPGEANKPTTHLPVPPALQPL